MPEIAEVARAVHHIRKNLVGKTLAVVKAQDDSNVFGKVGTSGAEFQKALTGKKVIGAGQQGKYFWMIMSSPPHPVFHFGMTGWFHIRGQSTYYYRKESDGEEVWPPRFWKFTMQTLESPKVSAAFTDSRRFSRVRLVDCVAEAIRQTTPLKENGPDPVLDKNILTASWLEQKMNKKHVPIKALLLDQANISGIGNWVGDEILYNAQLHPEQYSDTFTTAEVQKLHTSMMYICQTAVDHLADSTKFPDDWLFKHRWGKGKKDAPTSLPNGEAITFLTVGGRTSCVVPSIQKKTGPISSEAKLKKEDSETEEPKIKKERVSRKRKIAAELTDTEDAEVDIVEPKKAKASRSAKKISTSKIKSEKTATNSKPEGENPPSKNTTTTPIKDEKKARSKPSDLNKPKDSEILPRRRSQRQSKAGGVV